MSDTKKMAKLFQTFEDAHAAILGHFGLDPEHYGTDDLRNGLALRWARSGSSVLMENPQDEPDSYSICGTSEWHQDGLGLFILSPDHGGAKEAWVLQDNLKVDEEELYE